MTATIATAVGCAPPGPVSGSSFAVCTQPVALATGSRRADCAISPGPQAGAAGPRRPGAGRFAIPSAALDTGILALSQCLRLERR